MPRRGSTDIDAERAGAAMQKGVRSPVIPGFQGLMRRRPGHHPGPRRLGHKSAVAVAAAVKADRCDIYTDVDGVYTTDPRIVAARASSTM
jgi:aspartate kinase